MWLCLASAWIFLTELADWVESSLKRQYSGKKMMIGDEMGYKSLMFILNTNIHFSVKA